jgi:hypothetical protein
VTDASPTPGPASEPARFVTVTAVYQLSEAGRKALLLAGGDGRALQQPTIQVPPNRLHLVSVDAQGVARLKLRPRFEMDVNQHVVRADTHPTYDAPPTLEDLFRDAARNHELERVYQAERTVTRARKRETERERRAAIAQAFLADKAQRALATPPVPTPTRCCLLVPGQGRVVFDVRKDEGVAREVPPEAFRRFRVDEQARRVRNQQARAVHLALHEEKLRYIAEWVAQHGTPDLRARHAAGVLPMADAVEAIADQAFAAVGDRPIYTRDGVATLQAHLRQFPEYTEVAVSPRDLVVTSAPALNATAEQWAVVRALQAAIPDATVILRSHRLSWKRRQQAPSLTLTSALVTQEVSPFTLRREFATCAETSDRLISAAEAGAHRPASEG